VLKPGPWSPWGHRNDSLENRVVFAFTDGEENALSIPVEGTSAKTGAMVTVRVQNDSLGNRVVFAFTDREENALSIPVGGTGAKTVAMVPVGHRRDRIFWIFF